MSNYDEKVHSTFIGHGVKMDLKSLKLIDVPYICTAQIEVSQDGRNKMKKLKHLVSSHLNARIQDGHHSSIIDARCTLALFLLLHETMKLNMYGPDFIDHFDLISQGRRRRNKIFTAASTRSLSKALNECPEIQNQTKKDKERLPLTKLNHNSLIQKPSKPITETDSDQKIM